jgi:hypothetical protein
MGAATTTVLFELQSPLIVAFVFFGNVIVLFALGAGERNHDPVLVGSHIFPLSLLSP